MIIAQFVFFTMLIGMVGAVVLLTRNPWVSIFIAAYAVFLAWAFSQVFISVGG